VHLQQGVDVRTVQKEMIYDPGYEVGQVALVHFVLCNFYQFCHFILFHRPAVDTANVTILFSSSKDRYQSSHWQIKSQVNRWPQPKENSAHSTKDPWRYANPCGVALSAESHKCPVVKSVLMWRCA